MHLFQGDGDIDKLQPQKAATPISGRCEPARAFQDHRPNAVVDEKSCMDGSDLNAQRVSAMEVVVKKLRREGDKQGIGPDEVTVRTGSEMLDQFQPWFFSVAFPFVFKGNMAMPDLEGRSRYRRSD